MAKDCHTVWQNCLEVIRKEISAQSFQTWFQPIKAVKLENNVLTIAVPSPFFYEWLEEYYVHLLKKAIDTELGPSGKLEYSIVMKTRPANTPFTLQNRQTPNPGHANPMYQQQPQHGNFGQQQGNNYEQNTSYPQQSQSSTQGYGQQSGGMSTMPEKRQQQPYTGAHVQQKSGNSSKPQQQPNRNKTHVPVQSSMQHTYDIPTVNDPEYRESNLNPNYTFGTYIEGDCNRLARSAGIAIAKKPGITSFNPLVVYGGVGLGKTHLAQAVGNEIKQNDHRKFVLYVSSEQFTTQFIEALKNNNVNQFTEYYLKVDVLIVDDIQFLARKEKTQETFFHIFNRLHQSGRQIIMTSDRPPRVLEGLTDRLLSRFKWGLTADIQKPDFETRVAIVQQKLTSEGINVPEDVVEYLAYNIDSNIRELEGVLVSLVANASLMSREIDLDMAKSALLNIVRNTEKEITVEFIQQVVAEYFSISVEELKSKTRKKDIANARQIAMYFSKEYTKEPLKAIGDHFGGRDHSTVVHASKTVSQKSDSDALYNRILEELLDQMNIKK
ncbi:chromosomal replication initiator protein DnaA [Limibacter armeniacum]|uniref:chromosomal replication initiator protein DnaA n=1 Tax=Limibacter armeniacum TaxID=466084 RepID=UPI002FE66E6B